MSVKLDFDFTEEINRKVAGVEDTILQEVANFKAEQTDLAISRKLVEMGWTPPPEIQEKLDALL